MSARVPGDVVIPARSTPVDDDIVDAEIVEDGLCLCGCGQPPRSGSFYFNRSHQAHAERKAAHVAPDDDPILMDDGMQPEVDIEADDFIEESDDDDPILEDD